MKKKVPRLKTDRQAEAFLAQDLSNLDFSQFKPERFEFEKQGGADQHACAQAAARSSESAGKGPRYPLYAFYSGNSGAGSHGDEIACERAEQWHCPTQAKGGLEWATGAATQSLCARKSNAIITIKTRRHATRTHAPEYE